MTEPGQINTILETILKEAMGLNTLSVGPSSLKHALNRRMRSLDITNTLQYLKLIKTSPPELNELIEEVTVNETWFFRDEAPFIALRDFANQFLLKNKGQPIKLLSIPCSTGEEPYSMAIALIEAGIPHRHFTIDAVDISRRSLAVAQKALYRSNSFRGPHAQMHRDYFTKGKQGYALDQAIKDCVRFHRGNLIHLSPPLTDAKYQVIFCRNLLIYLDSSFHQQAINTFDSLLADDGLLIIGHAEAGIFSNSRFCPAPYPKAFAFQKKAAPSGTSQSSAKVFPPHTSSPYLMADQQQSGPSPHPFDVPGKGFSPITRSTTPPPPHHDHCDQAIMACEEHLRQEGASAEGYYQLAALFEQKKAWSTAIKMLKKATYLDPNYIDAIDMLAAIYQRLGDETNYQACLNRGQRILSRLSCQKSEVKE